MIGTILKLACPAVAGAAGFSLWAFAKHKLSAGENTKKYKRLKSFMLILTVISAWYFTGAAIGAIRHSGISLEKIEFAALFPDRVTLLGISFAQSTVEVWGIILVVLILALIFRLFIFPKFKDTPHGVQNLIELAVESAESVVSSTSGKLPGNLPVYIFTVGVMLIGCALTELFGLRPPTADLEVTFSLALMTLFLINYYSIRKKGLRGRIKGLASPSPIIFPMRILSDISTPVSLACRLYGNMLGGLIVMDLLRSSLGGYSVGLTSLAGIFFNLFHPLIQAYIFIILSMTFINEAAE